MAPSPPTALFRICDGFPLGEDPKCRRGEKIFLKLINRYFSSPHPDDCSFSVTATMTAQLMTILNILMWMYTTTAAMAAAARSLDPPSLAN
jgi:hypothetical protein